MFGKVCDRSKGVWRSQCYWRGPTLDLFESSEIATVQPLLNCVNVFPSFKFKYFVSLKIEPAQESDINLVDKAGDRIGGVAIRVSDEGWHNLGGVLKARCYSCFGHGSDGKPVALCLGTSSGLIGSD